MLLLSSTVIYFFFFNDTATTEIYTLSLHDALPISRNEMPDVIVTAPLPSPPFARCPNVTPVGTRAALHDATIWLRDRKSTRLNSSHSQISYAVFCLKKKKKHQMQYSY